MTKIQNVCAFVSFPPTCSFACVSYQKQQQHHICMVTHTRYMQGRPQVFVLQVHIQASLDQKFSRKHVVMASALQNANPIDFLISSLQKCIFPGALLTINSTHEWFSA